MTAAQVRAVDLELAEELAQKHGYTLICGHHCHPTCADCKSYAREYGVLPGGRFACAEDKE